MIAHDDLDAVILAGGRSERLNGIVAPFHKPFLVVNGRSLVVRAVEEAISAGADRVVVVATGENAMPVQQLVGHYPEVRIVLASGGPGHALYTGLEMCTAQRVLVMMGDNLFAPGDVKRVVDATRYAIGVRTVSWTESERFTRLVGDRWVEGDVTGDTPESAQVWCGPLVIQRQRGLNLLERSEKIGPHLSNLAPVFNLVTVQSVDVGVPHVVRELTREETVT